LTQPRITPGGRRELGPAIWAVARIAGRATGTEPPNLFTTLGRHRRLFWGWLWFAGRLMPRGKLPRRDTELVILRVAHLRDCTYEFEHHARLGRRAGVLEDDVQRVMEGPSADGWSPRERAILNAVDELHETGDLGEAAWSALQMHLDERHLIELCMLIGHYEMLATTIAALRIQPDAKPPRRLPVSE
jgi:AhpD family alkylhydroperoxidase